MCVCVTKLKYKEGNTMIRTNVVYIKELGVEAYRRKIPSGGVSLEVIDKNGKIFNCIITGKIQDEFFQPVTTNTPNQKNILNVATSKTEALKYYILPTVSIDNIVDQENTTILTSPLKKSIVNQFDKFVTKFTDENGVFSQQQLNLSLIQFAYRSNIVSSMIYSKNYTTNQIIEFVLKTRAEKIAKISLPSGEYVKALIHILNELCQGVALQMLSNSISARIDIKK